MPALIVDHNRHACRLVSTILTAITRGETRTCNCPSEAYVILQNWRPGMIITDFNMTPIDGLAFARQLRANPDHGFRLQPILLMTAETPNQALVEGVKAAGIDGMITRPIVPEALNARMEWAVNAARERAAEAQRAADSRRNTWLVD